MNVWRRLSVAVIVCGLGSTLLQAQDGAKPPETPAAFKALKYRSIGPAAGGRVSRVAGIAGDPTVYYAATASGGVWKSTDARNVMEVRLRRPADLLDRIDRRGALEPERRLRRIR